MEIDILARGEDQLKRISTGEKCIYTVAKCSYFLGLYGLYNVTEHREDSRANVVSNAAHPRGYCSSGILDVMMRLDVSNSRDIDTTAAEEIDYYI